MSLSKRVNEARTAEELAEVLKGNLEHVHAKQLLMISLAVGYREGIKYALEHRFPEVRKDLWYIWKLTKQDYNDNAISNLKYGGVWDVQAPMAAFIILAHMNRESEMEDLFTTYIDWFKPEFLVWFEEYSYPLRLRNHTYLNRVRTHSRNESVNKLGDFPIELQRHIRGFTGAGYGGKRGGGKYWLDHDGSNFYDKN